MLVTINRNVHQQVGGPCRHPRAPNTTRRSRAKSDRRIQLIAAAERLVAERGFLAVRLEDIGAAAGVSGPPSTGTSRTRKRCSSNCWSASVPGCSPAPPTSWPHAADARVSARRADRLPPGLRARRVRPDPHPGPRPRPPAPTAKRQVRKAQRQYVEIWVDVLRQLNDISERGRRAADGARGVRTAELDPAFSVKPGTAKAAEASSRAVLRAMTVAALTSADARARRLVPGSPAADRPSDGSEDPEHRADDDQDDADVGPQDR